MKKIFTGLTFWIFFAMAAGIVVGAWVPVDATIFAPLGDIFIQLIKMLVVPLVFVSIVLGASALGLTKSAGKTGGLTMLYIAMTTLLAVCLACLAGAWFKPGAGMDPHAVQMFASSSEQTGEIQSLGFWQTILSFIPANPFASLVNGNILEIIFFGLFLGFGISTLGEERKNRLSGAFQSILDALIWCIKIVMWVAPIGVFGLMANAMQNIGFDLLLSVANVLWIDLALVIFMGWIIYPLTVALFSKKVKAKDFIRAMVKPQAVAFSTASSLAALPINMEVCEQDLKISKSTTSFVIPLGATINMTGNAMYYVLVAIFFSQFYGIDLTVAHYVAIGFTASIGAIGQAGVPGPSFLLIAILAAAGIPVEGLPLFYALDRIFDMLRTTLNITGDAACAAVID